MTRKERDAEAAEKVKILKDRGDALPALLHVGGWIYKLNKKKDGYEEQEPI